MTPISVKPLYLIIIDNANEYVEETNGNKYLTLIPTDTAEDWKSWKSMTNYRTKSKILLDQQILIQVIMIKDIWNKIQFRWWFTSEKTIELHDIVIAVKSIFNDGNK